MKDIQNPRVFEVAAGLQEEQRSKVDRLDIFDAWQDLLTNGMVVFKCDADLAKLSFLSPPAIPSKIGALL